MHTNLLSIFSLIFLGSPEKSQFRGGWRAGIINLPGQPVNRKLHLQKGNPLL